MLADRLAHSAYWLKGPYGPPFFNVALFMGILYGGIGLAIARRRGLAFGALGPFLGIAVPLLVLTRVSEKLPWAWIVVALFIAAVWATIFAIGWLQARLWGGALSMLGALAGYGALEGIKRLSPGMTNFPVVLLDGMLSGMGMATGIAIARKQKWKP